MIRKWLQRRAEARWDAYVIRKGTAAYIEVIADVCCSSDDVRVASWLAYRSLCFNTGEPIVLTLEATADQIVPEIGRLAALQMTQVRRLARARQQAGI